jgi:hypothetical protein
VIHACHPKLPGRLRSGRIAQASPGKKKIVRPHLNGKKAGRGGACLSSQQWGEAYNRPAWAKKKKQDHIFKITRAKKAGGVVQIIELLHKHEILNSNPITKKKKKIMQNGCTRMSMAGYSGLCLQSQLLRRTRSGGSWFKVSLGK